MDRQEDSPKRLSDELGVLGELCRKEGCTFGDLVAGMADRGHALIALFLAVFFFIPVPLPGVSILFGLVIMTLGLRMVLGKPPWFPKRWLDHTISGSTFGAAMEKSARWMKKLEKVVQPRGRFLSRNRWVHKWNGLVFILGGFLLALPLPPLTNAPPALGVILLSIGILEQDGLFVLFGYGVTALVGLIFTLAALLGVEGIHRLMERFL